MAKKNKKGSSKKEKNSTPQNQPDINTADEITVDDLLTSTGGSNSAGIKSDAPKKIAPLKPRKAVPEKKPESSTSEPKKKRIVISSDLPDYDAIREQEIAKDKKAKEEAERKAREEAERKAREEAERKAREEAERKAREEAERKAREEAERKAREEAERKAREEAERKAREEAERKAREEAERKAREEAERKAREEAERKEQEEIEKRRLEAEEFTVEEIAEINQINEDEDDDDDSTVSNFINNIRQNAEKVVADIENKGMSADTDDDAEYDEVEQQEEPVEESGDNKKGSTIFDRILDEDVDEIISERSEKTEFDKDEKSKKKSKKNLYAFFGVIFAVFACLGFITVASKLVSIFGEYASGDNKKNSFEAVVYPAVIMNIESFETPAELPSDQIITAAIWSMIMSEDIIDNYEKTFDVVKIPAVDVESYAVKLFGENLPELNHTTVGSAEARFYYNEETQSYNVPISPVTYTYSPKIKGANKNGNTYTIIVDYMDELPEWLPQTSSKSVEFKLTETNGGYTIDSMKIISTTSNGAL